MDSRSQSDGGGERRGGLQSSSTERDEGRAQPQSQPTADGPSDPGTNCRLRPQTPPVLSLDQILISSSSNEYTDGPSAAQRSPASQQRKADVGASTTNGQPEAEEERSNNLRNLHTLTQHGNASIPIPSRDVGSQSSSAEGSQNSIRTRVDGGPSGQRLPGSPANGGEIIRSQPKLSDSEELKPLNEECRDVAVMPGNRMPSKNDKHSKKCSSCGRCPYSQCVQPRVLPSCWMCGQRCLCSPYSAVEYGTCICCIKGLFYHCSNDDEDTSADKPCSCSQPHCCARWTAISVLSLFFPCLLCYLPAKGCLAMCQCCYDRVSRPGCQCKNPTSNRYHEDSTTT